MRMINVSEELFFHTKNYVDKYLVLEEELIELYKKMQDEGILTNYINAISNIYKINIRSKNIEKYNSVMSSYRSGEYGEDNLTIAEILEIANEKNLIERMTLPELQYLSSNSSGITKLFFAEEIKKRLDKNINDVNCHFTITILQ